MAQRLAGREDIRTCEEGPDVLKASCFELLKKQHISIASWDTLYPKVRFKEKDISLKDALPLISDFNTVLSDKVFDAMQKGHFPVVLEEIIRLLSEHGMVSAVFSPNKVQNHWG